MEEQRDGEGEGQDKHSVANINSRGKVLNLCKEKPVCVQRI